MTEQLSIPFVNRPASRARAVREQRTGRYAERRELILELLYEAGPQGLTWRQLSNATTWHHGTVSGVLSKTHSDGDVVMLREMRDGCHPYVAREYVPVLDPSGYWVKPAETKAGRRRVLSDELADACRDAIAQGWTPQSRALIARAISNLDSLDRR